MMDRVIPWMALSGTVVVWAAFRSVCTFRGHDYRKAPVRSPTSERCGVVVEYADVCGRCMARRGESC